MLELINTDEQLLDVYSDTISNVYTRIAPSVVHIRNISEKEEKNTRSGRGESMGSGFIISSDGYIISNHHVADKAKDLFVTLDDGNILKAESKGTSSLLS